MIATHHNKVGEDHIYHCVASTIGVAVAEKVVKLVV